VEHAGRGLKLLIQTDKALQAEIKCDVLKGNWKEVGAAVERTLELL
jgi:hypothetical protein